MRHFAFRLRHFAPVAVAGSAVYLYFDYEKQHFKEKTVRELVRLSLAAEDQHLADYVKILILKRNLYHLDGISYDTRLPHDTFFWLGTASMGLILFAGLARFSQKMFTQKLKNSSSQCRRDECCQMLTRATWSINSNRTICRERTLEAQLTKEIFDQIKQHKQWKRYQNDFKVLGFFAVSCFAIGIVTNLDHMKKSSNISRILLKRQWDIDELDHESTVRLLSTLIYRNLGEFNERDLRTVADYVAEQTNTETYWDAPSTYLNYSPLGTLVIMQFLFNEMELNMFKSCPWLSSFLEDAFVHYSTVDESGSSFWERTWIGKSYLEWGPRDYECREYLLKYRQRERELAFELAASRRLAESIDRSNRTHVKHGEDR